MKNWDEIRTASAVARLGTLSGAAEALGIHRATVARHIDALEAELGSPLFHRHARGYTPTDAGRDLAGVARTTEERFGEWLSRTRGRAATVSGELIVTAIELLAPVVVPALAGLGTTYPDIRVRFEAAARLYKLEFGEAHVAIRGGQRPDHPDNVVEPFGTLQSALYAHRRYIARRGRPSADLQGHDVITEPAPGTLVSTWLRRRAPQARVVFASASPAARALAIEAGLGIGFQPVWLAARHPDLVQVAPPEAAWDVPFWLVTHVDLHRTRKVQAALEALRQAV